MLALALATAGALVAAPTALRPMRAYATDGIEVADEADSESGAHDEMRSVNCIDADWNVTSCDCAILSESTEMPLKGGWWLLEDATVPKDKAIEVAGDVSFVCSGKVDLGDGYVKVAKGGSLRLYADKETGVFTYLLSNNSHGSVQGIGAVPDRPVGCSMSLHEEDWVLDLNGRGTRDGKSIVSYVAADGTQGTEACTMLDDKVEMPIKDGWWLLDHQCVAKDKVIEVTGDAHFVCSGPIDLVTGHIHVAKGAHLSLYAEQGYEDSTSIATSRYKWGAILGDGAVGDCAFDVFEGHQVKYSDETGLVHRFTPTQFECDLGTFDEEYATLNSAWYFVSRDRTFNHRIDVAGDAKIVLGPGATLTCTEGIHVPNGSALTVYSLNDAPGKLVANASEKSQCAGIGGNDDEGCGVVTVCSGNVEATGGADAAGIGGGEDGPAGKITIRGGSVFARSREFGAGLGCGQDAHGGSVEITGGSVTAMGGEDGAGIGGGEGGNLASIAITGGEIKAVGKGHGAGIGGGEGGDCVSIVIRNAKVSADIEPTDYAFTISDMGDACSAAIGSGLGGNGGDILIEDATVTANACAGKPSEEQTDKCRGAAIGTGYMAKSRVRVSIARSNVIALADEGAAIGGGADGCGCEQVDIKDSTVHAESRYGAGIGGGVRHGGDSTEHLNDGCPTTIDNSNVTAISRGSSAGIGGAFCSNGSGMGDGGDVRILGGSTIDAQSGTAFAIGAASKKADSGKLDIDWGLKVTDLSKNVGQVATKAERVSYCQQRGHVKVEPGESRK